MSDLAKVNTEYYKILDLADIVYKNEEGIECIEIWKDIVGFEDFYQISNLGRGKSLCRSVYHSERNKPIIVQTKILKQGTDTDGYLHFGLSIGGKVKTYKAHRLVGIAFIPNPENKHGINHKKGDKKDNRFFMLEWNTIGENTKHAYDIGLQKGKKGSDHNISKLTEKEVLEIRQLLGYLFQSDIAKLFNVSTATVSMIINRISWTHI